MFYYTIKNIHVTAVVLSFLGFALRVWWMLRDNPLRGHKLVRILPHVVDSVLLVSAIVLSVMISQYPLSAPWLTAKLIGLLAYIGLGMLALRHAPTLYTRSVAALIAMLVYVWIISVATNKHAFGFLATW